MQKNLLLTNGLIFKTLGLVGLCSGFLVNLIRILMSMIVCNFVPLLNVKFAVCNKEKCTVNPSLLPFAPCCYPLKRSSPSSETTLPSLAFFRWSDMCQLNARTRRPKTFGARLTGPWLLHPLTVGITSAIGGLRSFGHRTNFTV